ncbi:MAG: hypothetical protein LBM19_00850 [Holosporales bacterium]|jgi:hypothetical protein|nr:hypothetical protein [Holosporales bacterium]
MTNLSILKIESKTGTLLISRNATQEIFPVNKCEIRRNIDCEPIVNGRPTKLRCVVVTKDPPDASILRLNDLFTIHSIVKFRINGLRDPPINYVKDSREEYEDHVIFRPILEAFLTNFSCRNDNSNCASWKLEFEEK